MSNAKDFSKTNSMYWVFTINNPVDDQEPASWADVEYAIWQKEKGANGTVHLQGYCVFAQKKRLSWLKKNAHPGAHWEGRLGSHEQAKEYSRKAETRIAGPWETGTEDPKLGSQGKRNDLMALKRKLDAGKTEAEIAKDEESFPIWAKFNKIIPRYRILTGKQRDWPVFTQVIWGAPGLGKTRKARDLAGPDAFWLSRPAGQTVWFDGYIGQETIVIDEFYGWISFDLLCRLLDRYPLNVETKGGSTPMTARKVIITSNVAPLAWYPNITQERIGALWRRLEMPLGTVEHMLVPYVPPVAPAPPVLDPAMAAAINNNPMGPEEVQRVFDELVRQGAQHDLLADELLDPSELGGDHLVPYDPYRVIEVEPARDLAALENDVFEEERLLQAAAFTGEDPEALRVHYGAQR